MSPIFRKRDISGILPISKFFSGPNFMSFARISIGSTCTGADYVVVCNKWIFVLCSMERLGKCRVTVRLNTIQ